MILHLSNLRSYSVRQKTNRIVAVEPLNVRTGNDHAGQAGQTGVASHAELASTLVTATG